MSRYHGKKGVTYLSASAAGAAVNVVNMTAWSLNMSTDKVEVTAFGDTNKVYVQGLKDVSGSLSGFWSDSDDSLFDAADSADGIRMYLYPSSDAPLRYFYGTAWLDASIDTGVGDAVSINGDFAAAGAWGRNS